MTLQNVFLLWKAEKDVADGIRGSQIVPHAGVTKEDIIAAVEANVISMIEADRKVTALKELQVWFPVRRNHVFLMFC